MAGEWYKDPETIIKLLPVAQALIEWIVKLIQSIFPAKTGAEKKQVAMKYVGKVLPGLPEPVASDMIDATVEVLKLADTAGFKNDVSK